MILHVREEEHTQNVPKKLSLFLEPISVILHVREEEHTQNVLTDSCCAMEGEVHKCYIVHSVYVVRRQKYLVYSTSE